MTVMTERDMGIDIQLVFWDLGSNVSLVVTKEFARRSGWIVTPVMQLFQSTNHQPEIWITMAQVICFVDLEGLEQNRADNH